MLDSEITHFEAYLRSVIEAKCASLSFSGWTRCTVAILLNGLISIKSFRYHKNVN